MTLKKLSDLPFVEDIIYISGGIILAFIIYSALGFGLQTDKPVLTVVSGSMEPTLSVGDLIVISGKDVLEIEKGDIIVFNPGIVNKLIVHRVYEVIEDRRIDKFTGEESVIRSFRTKGDNNNHVDVAIPAGNTIKEQQC